MEREANPPPRPLLRPLLSASSSTTSSDFVRNIQAVFKRPRPLGVMPSNLPRAQRILVSQKEGKPVAGGRSGAAAEAVVVASATDEESSITLPSVSGTLTFEEGRAVAPDCWKGSDGGGRGVGVGTVVMDDCGGLKRVEFLTVGDACRRSFACEEGRSSSFDAGSAAVSYEDLKQQEFKPIRSSGMNGQLLHKAEPPPNQHFMAIHQMTRSLASIASSATTMSVNSTSAPRIMSTTYNSHSCRESGSHTDIGESNGNLELVTRGDCMPNTLGSQASVLTQGSSYTPLTSGIQDQVILEGKGSHAKGNDGDVEPGKVHHLNERSSKGESIFNDVKDSASLTKNSSSHVNSKPPPPSRTEKSHHKKHSDPDAFYKVNGKLYQKLGKIGSGGSSEVHKVIASDCTIYALKKIKLKGRDYPTAYGFCQEIEYLNKLKGKSHIIQLIDYEVTDKTLLEDVMSGINNKKDGRIMNDTYIYMLLEYGEVDLAHMVAQKWKENDGTNWNTDENWLRFYWQQMLLAVNTIHEERIVHSDLKPANFMLVKGSLKLIDFGIAKAIMSDTTNIQRDSQVGTLNYMSPEAFMWNEHDVNGNTIKCGRPSDIWSLGCILYQMVYGKTPFADYKTFWAKFKVITDRNHKISYDPLPNIWLIDLMKKCLAWDRNKRWKIPQLLQHPFLVPPMPRELPPSDD